MIDRILIVGQGSIGIRHAEISRKIFPNADIRILRHRDSVEISNYADSSLANKEEVKIFDPQIAVICNPSSFHIDIAIYLARYGVNLLIEKPLSNSLDRLDELIEITKKKNITVLVGYNLRYKESLIKFRDYINAKNIGKILSVHCEAGQFLPDWRPNTDYRKTVSAQKFLGGGVLLELSHEIDYLRWLFGEIEWVNGILSRQSNLEIDVEDYANLIMGLQNSTIIINLKLDFYRKDSTRTCIVHGEEGSLKWDAISGSVHQFNISKNEWEEIFKESNLDNNQTYLSEWKDFVNCIEQKKQPKITLEDGLKVMQIIEATRQSSSSKGSKVFVNDVI